MVAIASVKTWNPQKAFPKADGWRDDKVNLQCYVCLASSPDWQDDLCQMDSHYLLRRAAAPPVKSPNIVSKRSSQIKSGETYFGRSLVFPGQIGSLFRLRCQPSSVKRKVKGPLLTSVAISDLGQNVNFPNCATFYVPQNSDHLIDYLVSQVHELLNMNTSTPRIEPVDTWNRNGTDYQLYIFQKLYDCIGMFRSFVNPQIISWPE